jgi:subtilisin-like proprotein convertase family protein
MEHECFGDISASLFTPSGGEIKLFPKDLLYCEEQDRELNYLAYSA